MTNLGNPTKNYEYFFPKSANIIPFYVRCGDLQFSEVFQNFFTIWDFALQLAFQRRL